jgi:uncharacterized protein YqjF (DUF2071 family)
LTGTARDLAGAVPVARPVGHQRWRDLLFLHWPMPPAAVRPRVPAGLELHLHEGQAWVTAIPFRIEDSLPVGAPRALAITFLETNLRTYVLGPDGERGIFFWSLEASSLLAVAAARLAYGLPYFPARMSMRRMGSAFEYATRRWGGGAGLTATWTVGAAQGSAAPGTRDHFLIERYALYVPQLGGLRRARVRHQPYPLHEVGVEALSETLLAAAGLPAPDGPPICHASPGVDVEIFGPARVTP